MKDRFLAKSALVVGDDLINGSVESRVRRVNQLQYEAPLLNDDARAVPPLSLRAPYGQPLRKSRRDHVAEEIRSNPRLGHPTGEVGADTFVERKCVAWEAEAY